MTAGLPYLFRLAARLADGLRNMDRPRAERHAKFILSHQQPDGGFTGREGDSDLYYTAFAVRGLAMLDRFNEDEAASVARFLQSVADQQVSVIDLVSWLYCALVVQMAGGPQVVDADDESWIDELVKRLESFRTKDGGYAKTLQGAAGSTYHSFLIALCYELVGRPLPQPNRLIQFIYDRQRDDGGFVEIHPMKRSGTNPSAAAVAVLTMLDAMDEEIRNDVADFLKSVRSDEGGFLANTRIPFADTLSTFTGLLTARDLELEDLIPATTVRRFIDALELPGGGFRGASWDEASDVEYAFYALGTLALLSESRDQ